MNDQQPTEKQSKKMKSNLSPDGKPSKKGPKFSIYWIYGGILILLLSYYALFNPGVPECIQINSLTFKTEMLAKGDVQNMDWIDNSTKKIVRVYIKPDSLYRPFYQEKFKKAILNPKEQAKKGNPLFEFTVKDWKSFQDELNIFYAENKNISEVKNDPKT